MRRHSCRPRGGDHMEHVLYGFILGLIAIAIDRHFNR